MSYHEHKEASPVSVSCAVLTVSDSRTEEDDNSGRILRQKLEQNGHRVILHAILKNDMKALKDRLEKVAPDFEKAYENMHRIVEGL